jgi:GT2 family glycosyltransferase/glycosyltransferase involved in cell wall biosynthesis
VILLRALFTLLALALMPFLLLLNAASLAIADLVWKLFGKVRRASLPAAVGAKNRNAISVVIPTWNGRDLLEKYLPSIVAAARFHPDNEVIVVDNASRDGTADFVRQQFPSVRLLPLEKNLGFGGGNNAGVNAARNDVVVVMNNDMRVLPDTFERLLEGFQMAPDVFAVSAQIFFSDPNKRREETGLTEGSFGAGLFRLGHLAEETHGLYPAFYAGGGSSAYDREKFLELGGFHSLFHPFYMEDTDLSYAAWKRGWQVLYQPAAIVYHEHRGTIGKRFTPAEIDAVLKRNHVLMVWKNIHSWRMLLEHFLFLWFGPIISWIAGESPTRATLAGYWGAVRYWRAALAARWQARSLAVIDDAEAMSRSQAGVYRDRFLAHRPTGERPLDILFVSPYSLYPPTHGGGVFMYQAVKALSQRHRVHVLAFVDREEELETNRHLEKYAASVECVHRPYQPRGDFLGLTPYAVRCFSSDDFRRRVQRALFRHDVDILQLEYTQLGQYGGGLAHTPTFLFEHDVYFQATRRQMLRARGATEFTTSFVEWLRALQYEPRMLRRMDRVQACSQHEQRLLESVLGRNGTPKVLAGCRAAVDVKDHPPVFEGREPRTALFIGNFQHVPNTEALRFLVRQMLPRLRQACPGAELVVAGAEANPEVEALVRAEGVRYLGRVADIREPLTRYSVFVCPIFSGSGVRVKILEAFAAGIPVISTPLGAEGLGCQDGRELLLASDGLGFSSAVMSLFNDPARAASMAKQARQTAEEKWDWSETMKNLEASYRSALEQARPARAM